MSKTFSRTLDQWLADYAVSHKNPQNIFIHKICVPLITFTVFGLLWVIPTPSFFPENIALLNWSTLFFLFIFVFYMTLSMKYAIGALLQSVVFFGILFWMQNQQYSIFYVSLVLFVLAWIGQFYGHKIEGKKPSFLEDLLFLFIGPLWVLHSLYKTIGIENKINNI